MPRDSAGYYPQPGGEQYPSSTTILKVLSKPMLMPWAAKQERLAALETAASVHAEEPDLSPERFLVRCGEILGKGFAYQRISGKAGDGGTAVHKMIEAELCIHMGGEPPTFTPDPMDDGEQRAIDRWREWFKPKASSIVVWSMEAEVASKRHRFAGTLDLHASLAGKPTIFDWKTGKDIYWDARLQIASYGAALWEMGHLTSMPYGCIVNCPREKRAETKEMILSPQEMEEAFALFLCARRLWGAQNE